jgi:hypothetical protein
MQKEIHMKLFVPRVDAILLGAMLLVSVQGADLPAADVDKTTTYISGGIGEAEQQDFAAREKEFNLKLVFSLVEGNYLADVHVVVSDAKGRKVVEQVAEGPFFMARLPPGEYQVSATYGGKSVNRKMRIVANRLRTEYFRWSANPQDDLPVSRWLDKE